MLDYDAACKISGVAERELYRIFEEKQDEEISMVNDVIPVLRDEFLYTSITNEMLYMMNEVVKRTLYSFYIIGIHFYAVPKFEYNSEYCSVNVKDIIYKKW